MNMREVPRQYPELSPAEIQAIAPLLISQWQRTGSPYDFKYLPINEQIANELLLTRNVLFYTEEESASLRRGLHIESLLHLPQRIDLSSKATILKRRISQLERAWHSEDARIRKESGATLEDLTEILAPLGIPPVDQAQLQRPEVKLPGRKQGNLANYYCLGSTQQVTKSWGDVAMGNYFERNAPQHEVKVYGNTVLCEGDAFDQLIERHELQPQVQWREDISSYSHLTGSKIQEYKLVVLYKGWEFTTYPSQEISQQCPKDATYKPRYWNGLILPKEPLLITEG